MTEGKSDALKLEGIVKEAVANPSGSGLFYLLEAVGWHMYQDPPIEYIAKAIAARDAPDLVQYASQWVRHTHPTRMRDVAQIVIQARDLFCNTAQHMPTRKECWRYHELVKSSSQWCLGKFLPDIASLVAVESGSKYDFFENDARMMSKEIYPSLSHPCGGRTPGGKPLPDSLLESRGDFSSVWTSLLHDGGENGLEGRVAPWKITAEDTHVPVVTRKHIQNACIALNATEASQADELAKAFGVTLDVGEVMVSKQAQRGKITNKQVESVEKKVTADMSDATFIAGIVNRIVDNANAQIHS